MSSSTPSTPVVDLLTSMTLDSIEASSLQPRELMIARIAALVESAVAVGIDVDRVRGILTAIAPIVGTARVASATGKIAEALAIELVEFDG
jgi:4-carboxymuconolactone decarboxylase